MQWHPLIIRWCLSMYHYHSNLLHINTFKKYSSFTSPSVGFNPDIILQLVDDSDIAHLENYQENVILNFNEMKIKSDLVY